MQEAQREFDRYALPACPSQVFFFCFFLITSSLLVYEQEEARRGGLNSLFQVALHLPSCIAVDVSEAARAPCGRGIGAIHLGGEGRRVPGGWLRPVRRAGQGAFLVSLGEFLN